MTSGAARVDDVRRWCGRTMIALERLSLSHPLMVALLGLMAAAEQGLEHSLDDPTFLSMTATAATRALVFPMLGVYILTDLRNLKRGAVKALAELCPTALVGGEECDDHERVMVSASGRAELALPERPGLAPR